MRRPEQRRVLVIGCGAMARELTEIVRRNGLVAMDVTCLPARYHNTPRLIPDAVEERILAAGATYDDVFVAYGDCGTGGMLDRVLEGAHCYEFLAGSAVFNQLHESQPATFYLTDFLARHFDRLVWKGLGLDRWPQLLSDYFGNYERVVYLAQTDDPALVRKAEEAARRLGLAFELRQGGYGQLEPALIWRARSA